MTVVHHGDGGGGHRRGHLMTSLLILTLGTLLLPSAVSGASSFQGSLKNCYAGESRFRNETTCSFTFPPEQETEYWVEACCWFIFSFGEVESRWGCVSKRGEDFYGLCEGDDNSCTRYEKDPSGRSIRCLCTDPNCNSPNRWEGDNIFKQWKSLPGNKKRRVEGEGTNPTKGDEKPCDSSGSSGNFRVSALFVIVIAALFSRPRLSLPFLVLLLLTLGLTLPSTVSGDPEFQRANGLTCLSSSNATDEWGDRHCGDNETCCYYIFREVPNWGCATNPGTCEVRGEGEGRTLCKERYEGADSPPALLCTCNRRSCNRADGWEEDVLLQQWRKEREGEEGTATSTTEDPSFSRGAGGTRPWYANLATLLRAVFTIIF